MAGCQLASDGVIWTSQARQIEILHNRMGIISRTQEPPDGLRALGVGCLVAARS